MSEEVDYKYAHAEQTAINIAAEPQGWAIFYVGSEEGESRDFELQRDDETAIFADDQAAWQFVYDLASTGDKLALRTFRFVREFSPDEYLAIMKTCRKP
jgi:hypothetical protein